MLDTAIGPITNNISTTSFQMRVTHIGRHNQFRYNTFETIVVDRNYTGYTLTNLRVYGIRVSCHVKYRDVYGRLFADLYLE